MFQSSITLVKSVKGHYIGITKEEKGTVSLMLVMLDKGGQS